MLETHSGSPNAHKDDSGEMARKLADTRHATPHFRHPVPFQDTGSRTIQIPPEATAAVNFGTGGYFKDILKREEHLKNLQKPTQ